MPDPFDHLTDEALLARTPRDAVAFGAFYARHERAVGTYFVRRARDATLAADLTSETFAAALVGARRYSGEGPAVAWLFGIARHVWLRSLERRQVEDRARRQLGVGVTVDDAAQRAFEALAGDEAADALLAALPADQADAVRKRILEDVPYDELAVTLRCSPTVARQRVSRGLRALRARKETP